MIKIAYKDGQNWTDINGNVRNWTNAHDLYKDERTQSAHLKPEMYTYIWNGEIHDVQHIIWDVWHLEFWIKESELQEVDKLQSCSTIVITDVDNDLEHTVDVQTATWLNFSDPERMADTANWKVTLEYRTNKTPINKYLALSNVVTFVAGSTYYSKYAKLPYIGEKQDLKIVWGEDGEKLLHEINKTGYRVLFEMSAVDMETFKNDYNTVDVPTIDAVDIIEKLPLEISELGEDNYQIVMSVITVRTINNYYDSLANVATYIARTGGSPIYYSKFANLPYYEESKKDVIEWDDNVSTVLRELNKTGWKLFLYLNKTDMETFKDDWYQNLFVYTVSGTVIIEKLPLEIEENEVGFYQIIVSFVLAVDSVNKTTALGNVVTIAPSLISTYYSKYAKKPIMMPTNTITVDWGNNITKILRETSRSGYKMLLFGTYANMAIVNDNWNQDLTITIDAAPVIEKLPLELTDFGNGYMQIIMSAVLTTATYTADLGASHTHTLVVTDGSAYTYYSDYPVIDSVEDTTRSTVSNESGVETTTKGITRRPNIFKCWLDEADAFALKEHFEIGTSTLDTVAVLEKRTVKLNKLAYDLYECEVECLMTTNIQYPEA